MKTSLSFLAIALSSIALSGCVPVRPRPDKPDLAVTSLATTGAPTINADSSIAVPIRVVIRNGGTASAAIFKTATKYIGPQGTFEVAFTVPGQSSIWYPRTNSSLAPGSDVTFNGKVTFHSTLRGASVKLIAIADSCSDDEFMPNYCRVDESNEGNNGSNSVSLSLP